MSGPAVLTAIVGSAVGVAGALDGWLLAVDGDELRPVALAPAATGRPLGWTTPGHAGSAGFAAATGQPVARRLDPAEGPEATTALARLQPGATSVLAVPCFDADQRVVGVLEVVGKQGAPMFGIDDMELVTLLAGIAGAALGDGAGAAPPGAPGATPPGTADAAALADALGHLARRDPAVYRAVRELVTAVAGGPGATR